MIKSKRKVRNFINFLYRNYDVPRIPIDVHWHYPSVITHDGKCGFGVFQYKNGKAIRIDVACCKVGTTGVLSSIAHEFVHYLQLLDGRDMDNNERIEEEAEFYGAVLLGSWLSGKRDCPSLGGVEL